MRPLDTFAPVEVPMSRFSRVHLSESNLRLSLHSRAADRRTGEAEFLADMAEFDVRKMYLAAAYDSTTGYCIGELHMSEDEAHRRIQVARLGRRLPVIFHCIADGRLTLTTVLMLSKRLGGEDAEELLLAAANKTKIEIQQLLVRRASVEAKGAAPAPPAIETPTGESLSCDEASAPSNLFGENDSTNSQPAPARVTELSGRITPSAPGVYDLRLSIDEETHDDLTALQALLSHQVPSGNVAKVLPLAIKALRRQLEKRKFGATDRPRATRGSTNPRHIPAAIRRAVSQRDGGRCAFVSDSGRRCESRRFLEFDHAVPLAQGGETSVSNVRQFCRAHNQFAATRAYGAEFMERKVEQERAARAQGVRAPSGDRPPRTAHADEATRAVGEASGEAQPHTVDGNAVTRGVHAAADEDAARAAAESRAREIEAQAAATARLKADSESIASGLRRLGYRADEAKAAAAFSEDIPGASLEERLKKSLRYFAPKGVRVRFGPVTGPTAAAAS